MDSYGEELIAFWRALQKEQVEYILIGGYAIIFNGYHRSTGDLDIWLKDTLENRRRLRQAIRDCGMPDYPMIETMQFVPGWTIFHLNNALELDIRTTAMKGLEAFSFKECLEKASVAQIDGVNIPFLHSSQLLANKKAVNRDKDQADIEALEDIEQQRKQDEGIKNDPEPPFYSR